MRNFTWNRFPIKNLLIDSLLTPIVESTYLNRDMCKFESSQKDENRWQSTDSSKAYRNTSAFKMLALLHLQVTNTIQKSSCSSRALTLSKMFVLCLYYFVRNCLLPFCSYIFKTNEATGRTMLKQAEVQPRPNEYPQTLLIATLLPSVKTDIDTSKRIAEKRKIL